MSFRIGADTANAGLEYGQPLHAGVWRELLYTQWEGGFHLTFKSKCQVDDSLLNFLLEKEERAQIL